MAAEVQVSVARLSRMVLKGQAFQVKTEGCKSLFHAVSDWIDDAHCGALVVAPPRFGKTCASLWVLKALQKSIKGLRFFLMPLRKENVEGETAFFQWALSCIGHEYAGSRTKCRDRFSQALAAAASACDQGVVIVCVDEAHWLSDTHYDWFLNVCNEVEKEEGGCSVFFLMVGQPGLATRREIFSNEGKQQIIARFMPAVFRLGGISSEAELARVLGGYDMAKYPVLDGRPFLTYYVPKSYEAGWRLVDWAGVLWKAFSDVAASFAPKDAQCIVPMSNVALAVITILRMSSEQDGNLPGPTASLAEAAVKRSRYATTLKTLANL